MLHSEESLIGKYGLSGSGVPDDTLDDTDLRPEVYKAFGIDAQARPSNAMVDFWLCGGNQRALAYTHLYEIEFDPSESMVLTFSDHVVEIRGHGLDELYRGLKRHRVAFIWEADQPTARLSAEDEPVVTGITIQSRQESFEVPS